MATGTGVGVVSPIIGAGVGYAQVSGTGVGVISALTGEAEGYAQVSGTGVGITPAIQGAAVGIHGIRLAAAGSIEITGDEATIESILPGVTLLSSSGYLAVVGKSTLYVTETYSFVASGSLRISAPCRLITTSPELQRFIAAGGLQIVGSCGIELVTPTVTQLAAAGSIRVGGGFLCHIESVSPESLTTSLAAAGCLEIIGAAAIESSQGTVTALAANTKTGPALLVSSNCACGVIYPPVATFGAAGCIYIVTPDVTLSEVFETWALTGQAYDPAIWSGFDFNSFCVHRGRVYGAKDDGIYLLEGADDAGTPIHSGVRIGPHNYGIDREKRLRALRLGEGNSNGARVKITTGTGKEGYFNSDRGRVPVSRDLQDREFTIDIADFEQLSQLEIVPLVLVKR